MSALATVGLLKSPQVVTTTTAAICLLYSYYAGGLYQPQVQASSSSVLLLLCVYMAWSAYSAKGGSQGPCKGATATDSCDAAPKQQQAWSSQEQDSMSQGSTAEQPSSRPVRLAEPPFSADLSVPLGSNSSRHHVYSSSCKPRRRRLPRLSIELTPLPRLSVDFSACRRSSSRAASIRRSLDCCSRMTGEDPLQPSAGTSSFWDSAASGTQDAAGCSQAAGGASQQLQQQLPSFAAGEATASLGLSELPEGLGLLADVINETHLLQVGAMLGEASARGALAGREAGGPVGHPSSFYGSADTLNHSEPWELMVSEGNDNVMYWGWRKPLRKGLYMYMTRSVFLRATPAELRAFMMDDAYRVVWDQSMTVLRPILDVDSCSPCAATPGRLSSSGSGSIGSTSCSNAAVEAMAAATAARMTGAPVEASGSAGSSSDGSCCCALPHENAVMQAQVQFPKPMASRSYVYARRVWPRPSDGGCYCLSKACEVPDSSTAPTLPGRCVGVEDYSSGCVIRAPSPQLLPPGADAAPAAEVFMVYFEDSHVRPGLANLGIKKGLWPLVQRTDKALRVYQAGAAANTHLQTPAAAQQPVAAEASSALQPVEESCSSSNNSSSTAESTADSPRPAVCIMSRSASLNCCDLDRRSKSEAGVALRRSASLHDVELTRRLSSCSLPCFPLEPELDLVEPDSAEEEQEEQQGAAELIVTEAASSGSAAAACCISDNTSTADSCCRPSSGQGVDSKQPLLQQEQQQKQSSKLGSLSSTSKQGSSTSSSSWGWLGQVGSRVADVVRQSGQLLAAVSVVLWRSGPSVALMLPRFEWKLLSWAYSHISAPKQLLLGAPPSAAASAGSVVGIDSRLVRLSSHPLSEWAKPALVSKLTSDAVRRLPTRPLAKEELLAGATEAPSATVAAAAAMRGEAVLHLQLAFAATTASSSGSTAAASSSVGSCVGSTAGSDVASGNFSLSGSSCGCCCGSSSSVAGSRRCHRSGSSCSSCGGSSSVVRDETGGRRQRRVVVKLVQTAGLRVARRVARLTGITE